MKIIYERPPLFDLINAKFRIAGRQVIFAWGDKIYNPMRIGITPELMAHESVHGKRQGDNVEEWWVRYVEDSNFRLAEEIPAHQAEYRELMKQGSNRHARRTYMKYVAKRLASPLYGNGITTAKARSLLEAA